MSPQRVVLLHDPYHEPEAGPHMEFRLTYAGPLYAAGRDPVGNQPAAHRQHMHDVRKKFHPQLKRLWEITPHLRTGERSGPNVYLQEPSPDAPTYDIASLAAKHSLYGFHFVPLVTEDLNLICGLDILFLRPDRPGGVFTGGVWAGDIDNRLKTLLDALRIPTPNEEYFRRTPGDDENPFFCLLEDDKLITKVSVETDQLLDASSQSHHVHLVITVRLRPYEMHLGNMQFG
jgi:hypothetical protein